MAPRQMIPERRDLTQRVESVLIGEGVTPSVAFEVADRIVSMCLSAMATSATAYATAMLVDVEMRDSPRAADFANLPE